MSKKNRNKDYKEKNLRRKVEILKAQVKTQSAAGKRIESNTKIAELDDKEIKKALTKTFVFSISSFVLLAGLSYFGAFDLFTNLLFKKFLKL